MMKAELKIDKAGVEKIGVIVQLAYEIWPATYEQILPADQISYMMRLFYSPASLASQVKDKQHQFVIASIDDRPVAFASYGATEETGVFKLHKIYVHPVIQGKGAGRSIINYILNELKSFGAKALELNVNRNNPAKIFYEKVGFHVVREEDIDIGKGYYMNDYVMRKMIVVND